MSEELGRFLFSKRRVQGLRREDVAAAAFIGYEYYSRIERGSRIPLAPVLERISEVLQLDFGERDYVLSFTNQPLRPIVRWQEVPSSIVQFIRYQGHAPAYVIDRRLDMLYWNTATCEFYGIDLAGVESEERNVVWLMFTSSELRVRLRDWERHARRIVATCHYRWAGYQKDPAIYDLLSALRLKSQEFSTFWEQPEASFPGAVRKEIDHPVEGLLVVEQTIWQFGDNPELHLVTTTPLPEADTAVKLQRLFDDED
jgi:transcriptional regulator with XRE-family HTH domain